MSGANVGTAYMTISPRFDGLSSSVNRALGMVDTTVGGRRAGKRFAGGFLAGGAVAGAAASVVSGAINSIGSSISGAVARVDTIASFPRVMENMGYSAEEAQASIDRLSAGIDGMPTSLDGIVSMTQQLAPIAGGLDKATTLSLALNDALIASRASTADQSRAMQQYTQMLSTGKVDMQSWKTLQEVMPAQLNQISEAMLGAGKNGMDLYKSIQEGETSFDDFNAAIVRLDKEGTGKFESFRKQAEVSMGGIGTAAENVRNRVNRAMAKVLDAIGQETISGAINAFSSQFGNMAEPVVGFVEGMKDGLEKSGVATAFGRLSNQLSFVLPSLGQVKEAFSDFGEAAGAAIGHVLDALADSGAIAGFAAAAQSVGDGVSRAFSASMDALEPLIQQLPTARELFSALGNAARVVGDSVGKVLGGMADAMGSGGFKSAMSDLASSMADLSAAAQPVWDALSKVGEKLDEMGIDLGLVGQAVVISVQTSIRWVNLLLDAAEMLRGGVSAVVGWISGALPDVSAAFGAVVGFVSSVPGRIAGFFAGIGGRITAPFGSVYGTVRGVFDSVVGFASSIPWRIVGFFSGLGSRITAAIGSIRFPTPSVSWRQYGNGKMSFSLPSVSWYATGAAFRPGDLTLFGAGDATDDEYMLRERHLRGIAAMMRREMGVQERRGPVYNTTVYATGSGDDVANAITRKFRADALMGRRR